MFVKWNLAPGVKGGVFLTLLLKACNEVLDHALNISERVGGSKFGCQCRQRRGIKFLGAAGKEGGDLVGGSGVELHEKDTWYLYTSYKTNEKCS